MSNGKTRVLKPYIVLSFVIFFVREILFYFSNQSASYQIKKQTIKHFIKHQIEIIINKHFWKFKLFFVN